MAIRRSPRTSSTSRSRRATGSTPTCSATWSSTPATKGTAKRLIKALHGHAVGAHALTHAHPDHAGGSKRLVEAFDVPVWVGEHDRAASSPGGPPAPETWAQAGCGAPGPLRAGRRRALAARGRRHRPRLHRARHAGALRRARAPSGASATARWCSGDVLFNLSLLTTRARAARAAAASSRATRGATATARGASRRCEPELALFGHGPPLRDPAALTAFVAGFEARARCASAWRTCSAPSRPSSPTTSRRCANGWPSAASASCRSPTQRRSLARPRSWPAASANGRCSSACRRARARTARRRRAGRPTSSPATRCARRRAAARRRRASVTAIVLAPAAEAPLRSVERAHGDRRPRAAGRPLRRRRGRRSPPDGGRGHDLTLVAAEVLEDAGLDPSRRGAT